MTQRLCLLSFVALMSTGCVKQMAMTAMADALSGSTGGSFTQDDDLLFVGEAIPFALKTMESVAESTPKHDGIRETLCSSFTQYAVVYVQWPAYQARYDDYATYEAGLARTRRFLRRSEAYCFAAWDLRYPGFSDQLRKEPAAALARVDAEDVPLLYWTGAGWLSRISISKEDMDAIGELPLASQLLKRALELDEDWAKGTLHDVLTVLEPNLPMPGGLDRAREHHERALELAGGSLAAPYVSLATSVSLVTQDREEFVELMEAALEVDPSSSPEDQLANLYAQEQARFYLDHLDDLFVD